MFSRVSMEWRSALGTLEVFTDVVVVVVKSPRLLKNIEAKTASFPIIWLKGFTFTMSKAT